MVKSVTGLLRDPIVCTERSIKELEVPRNDFREKTDMILPYVRQPIASKVWFSCFSVLDLAVETFGPHYFHPPWWKEAWAEKQSRVQSLKPSALSGLNTAYTLWTELNPADDRGGREPSGRILRGQRSQTMSFVMGRTSRRLTSHVDRFTFQLTGDVSRFRNCAHLPRPW